MRSIDLPVALAAIGALCPGASAQYGELVAPDIARFYADASVAAADGPSIAIEPELEAIGPVPDGFQVDLLFSFSTETTSVNVAFPEHASLYGTGLVPGPLERTRRRTVLFNSDSFGWNDSTESLYESHPWVLAVYPDGSAHGLLFDTPARAEIDTRREFEVIDIGVFAEDPEMAVYVISGDHPQAVVRRLADIAGKPFMPPLWALGYHQARYSYFPAARVFEVAQEFRARQIPGEVIWWDIDYMDGFRMFTYGAGMFNGVDGFNTAEQLSDELDSIGWQSVAIVGPYIKRDFGYAPYTDLIADRDFYVASDASGNAPFTGPVWPGDSSFVDFLNARARNEYWGPRLGAFMDEGGLDGVWNDMNEPAVFVGSKTMDLAAWHTADADLGGPGSHSRYHNVYGMQMARATYDSFRAQFPEKRPFILTRSNHLGGHRWAATWTGDNNADWYHLDVSIQNVLNLGLSGQPHTGPDIGGFNGDGTAENFERWMGFGALLPFARAHTAIGNRDKEPWSFGPEVERTSRLALERRYRLLPHIYTLAKEAHDTGLPMARPLFFADPSSQPLRTYDNGFMLGDALVVAANTFPFGTPPRPPLDGLVRFGFTPNGEAASDICEPDLPALYLRRGHVVPSTDVVQHSRDPEYMSELTLLVALDASGEATGTLYEDAGDGYGYLSGDFLETTYRSVRTGDSVQIFVESERGDRARPQRQLNVRLLLEDGVEVIGSGLDGGVVTIQIPPTLPAPVLCAPEPEPLAVDGRNLIADTENGGSHATQTVAVRFADNRAELNGLYARSDPAGLRVGIAGNIPADGTAIALLIDAGPGGVSRVDVSNQSAPPSALPALDGIRLEPGFTPERMLLVNAFSTNVFADWLEFEDDFAGATKTFLGLNAINSGVGTISGLGASLGFRFSFDNNNLEGVSPLTADTAGTSTSGLEALIPWGMLTGSETADCPEVRLFAMLLSPAGEVLWHTLPAVPEAALQPNDDVVGFQPDFGALPGVSYLSVAPRNPADLAIPFGTISQLDIAAFVDAFFASGAAADFSPPFGVISQADVAGYVEAFFSDCR